MPEIILDAAVDSIQDAMGFIRRHIGDQFANLRMHVELAVEELLVNVASYAYSEESASKAPNSDKLILGCRWVNMDGNDQFCVWLRDWGRPFDPFREARKPDTTLNVEDRNLGGLGVHLIKYVSNHYVYSGADGSNTVELYFKADDPQ
ncbi:MAG: ATP-binding protein [Desulfovibrio sp.]|nr:ATP-binding protein [Desulfovibrio sp.]